MAKITKVRDLIPDSKNANKGTERGSGMLEHSLRTYGTGRSILIDKNGRIIAGNKTAEAAGALGLDKVVVVETDGRTLIAVQRMDLDLDDPKAREMAIADNRAGELNLNWDAQALAELIAGDVDVTKLFHENEIKDILEGEIEEEAPEAQVGAAEQLAEKWKTERGQIWQIGKHRLMCGDSTDRADFAELMGTQRASLVNTDPPYGVSYADSVDGKKNQKIGGWAKIASDDLREDGLAAVLSAAFKFGVAHTTAEAAFYIWAPAGPSRRTFEFALDTAALQEKQLITWTKDTFVMGHSDYHYQNEICFYSEKSGHHAAFYGDRAQSTAWTISAKDEQGRQHISIGNGLRISNGQGVELMIAPRAPKAKRLRLIRISSAQDVVLTADSQAGDLWRVSHDTAKAQHPTQKPAELAVRAIRNSSLPGEIVLDMFGGAGFTMAGAELTGRACYTMELEPKYCAVILERMAQMNLQPELVHKPALAAHGK